MRIAALVVCALACAWCRPLGGQQPTAAAHSDHLIVVRVSEEFFEPIAAQAIDIRRDVNDVILGTPVRGQSHTRGKIGVDISADPDDASLVFTFRGQISAKTVGQNGPATLHCRSTTRFECSNQVTFDLEHGFQVGKTSIRSTTNTTTDDVQINRRVGRRLIRRIAWRRVRENQQAANEVTAQHSRRDIVKGFDRQLSQQLSALNERLALTELVTKFVGTATETEYCVSSTDRHIQLCVRRKGTTEQPVCIPDERVAGAPIEVWVHSSIMDQNLFRTIRTVSLVGSISGPIVRSLAARFQLYRSELDANRTFANLRALNLRLLQRPAVLRLLAEPARALAGMETASDWIFIGFNDVAVEERRARYQRNALPVSTR